MYRLDVISVLVSNVYLKYNDIKLVPIVEVELDTLTTDNLLSFISF